MVPGVIYRIAPSATWKRWENSGALHATNTQNANSFVPALAAVACPFAALGTLQVPAKSAESSIVIHAAKLPCSVVSNAMMNGVAILAPNVSFVKVVTLRLVPSTKSSFPVTLVEKAAAETMVAVCR